MSTTAAPLLPRRQTDYHAHTTVTDTQRDIQTTHQLCLCAGSGMLLLAGICWLLESLFGWQTGLTPLALVGAWYLGLSLKYPLAKLYQKLTIGSPDSLRRADIFARIACYFESADRPAAVNRMQCGALPLQAAVPPPAVHWTAQRVPVSNQVAHRIFPGL